MDVIKRSSRKRASKQPYCNDFDYDIPKMSKKRRKKPHQEPAHDCRGAYTCNHCPLSFESEQLLFDHEEVHYETEHVNVCEECGLVFASKLSLLGHKRSKHKEKIGGKGSRFKCPDCNKTFLQKSGLRTHRTIHTGEKPFSCNVCGLSFRLNSSLQRHMCKEHFTYKPFKCDKCGKDFGHNSDLMHHMRSVHAKERLFVCQICHERFTTNVVLMRHINIHFELKLNQCKICDAKFSHSGSLYNHMKVHSDERAYQCQTCGKSYKLKSHLKNHSCKKIIKQITKKDTTQKLLYDVDTTGKDSSKLDYAQQISSNQKPVLRREFDLHVKYP